MRDGPVSNSKYALCIGINDYPGIGDGLYGCVNDAEDWAARLDKRGADVVLLLDAEATAVAIRCAIADRLARAVSGDLVVITFSGYGTWLPDVDSSYVDGYAVAGAVPDQRHEALCPHDVLACGPLPDDELFLLLTGREDGVRVVLILDACHCGAIATQSVPRPTPTRRVRFLPPQVFLPADQLPAAARIPARYRGRPRDAAILLTGCRDIEFSYDAVFDNRANGAFTYAAVAALDLLPEEANYRDWMMRIRMILPSQDHPQTPGLQGPQGQLNRPVFR